MEDFSTFKCTTIAELFNVIISYHIYTNVYYLVQWKVVKQLSIFYNIYSETFEKVL